MTINELAQELINTGETTVKKTQLNEFYDLIEELTDGDLDDYRMIKDGQNVFIHIA